MLLFEFKKLLLIAMQNTSSIACTQRLLGGKYLHNAYWQFITVVLFKFKKLLIAMQNTTSITCTERLLGGKYLHNAYWQFITVYCLSLNSFSIIAIHKTRAYMQTLSSNILDKLCITKYHNEIYTIKI